MDFIFRPRLILWSIMFCFWNGTSYQINIHSQRTLKRICIAERLIVKTISRVYIYEEHISIGFCKGKLMKKGGICKCLLSCKFNSTGLLSLLTPETISSHCFVNGNFLVGQGRHNCSHHQGKTYYTIPKLRYVTLRLSYEL